MRKISEIAHMPEMIMRSIAVIDAAGITWTITMLEREEVIPDWESLATWTVS